MKTKVLLFNLSLAILVFVSGCGSSKIDVPFSKFKTDKNYLRAVGSGVSPDMAIAKKIALQNAKAEIASSIQSVFNQVNTAYFEQYGVGATPDLSQKIEGMSQDVVSQVLSNVRIVNQEYEKIKKSTHVRCFVAIEMSKKEIGKSVMDGISQAKKDKIDFDEDQYRRIFDEALEQ
ncbi:MAG: LPP20 family lipoprotein [Dysgonamonadaceae bacterium]|jgi:hypothetical protein|nr:LPP20 family lipoprotein [Dysgonamonadaceae bacterium]